MLRPLSITILTIIAINITEGVFEDNYENKRSSPSNFNINDNAKELLDKFKDRMCAAMEPFGLPQLEPLKIENIDLNLRYSLGNLDIGFQRATVKKLSLFEVLKMSIMILALKFETSIQLPRIELDGVYNINGTIGDLFILNGGGDFTLAINNFTLGIDAKMKSESGSLALKSLDIDFSIEKLEANLENLDNNKEVNDLFNKIINEKGVELIEILWPEIEQDLRKPIFEMVNNLLKGRTVMELKDIITGKVDIFKDIKPSC